MPSSRSVPIALRLATQDDCRRLWEWRNERETREASSNTQLIPFEDHLRWFSRKIQAEDTRMLIIVDPDGRDVGYVRFDTYGNEAEISVSVDQSQRGKGYGVAAIRLASDRLLSEGRAGRIVARVKTDNPASIAAFGRAGYRPEGIEETSCTVAHVMAYGGPP